MSLKDVLPALCVVVLWGVFIVQRRKATRLFSQFLMPFLRFLLVLTDPLSRGHFLARTLQVGFARG
ncbi:hypothetical protein [Pectobacterium sp. A5351]|uniref:hypothetical protein n=1 Tax=Pectobacterium sp. A5351 TaxID=2914983 RepID=UPI00232B0FF3|nr:hypothetical protein [Pectobacterium sp. A5351]WCG83203.1 hypothetical protein O1Q74_00305 [Pectobacterium sp. A5351]